MILLCLRLPSLEKSVALFALVLVLLGEVPVQVNSVGVLPAARAATAEEPEESPYTPITGTFLRTAVT
jgi:hypothetical protein